MTRSRKTSATRFGMKSGASPGILCTTAGCRSRTNIWWQRAGNNTDSFSLSNSIATACETQRYLHAAQIGLGLFTGIGQAGDTPRAEAGVKQVVNPVLVFAMVVADVAHGGESAKLRVMLPQGTNTLPVLLGERADTVVPRDFYRDRFAPSRGIFQQAVLVELDFQFLNFLHLTPPS